MHDTVTVGGFRAEYRLPPSRFGAKQRLDRLLPEVAGEALERALDRAGVSATEIVCIRRLYVPVRLRLSRPDWALIADWTLLLADAIAKAPSESQPDAIVRYGSRPLALVGMGELIAQERFHYVWAWRQIGLWQGPAESAGPYTGALEFGSALVREPQLAVAVLAVLASRGLLRTLLRRMKDSWAEIAAAVLEAGGVRENLKIEGLSEVASETELSKRRATAFSARLARRAASVASHSRILSECRGVALPRVATFPLALLSLLECEPSLSRAGSKQLFDSARAIEDLVFAAPDHHSETAPGTAGKEIEVLGSSPSVRPSRKDRDAELPATLVQTHVRDESITNFGGLLFLLHIVEALKIPERLVSQELSGRGFMWFQHCLALALQPLAADDPAALAFCGLGPASQPPSEDQPPPSAEEEEMIGKFAAEIRNALAEALPQPARAPDRLMQFVCRRRAGIKADPGWIEARFDLREVSTEIRRAGLDLNPDFVPWLGVVMRFVYE